MTCLGSESSSGAPHPGSSISTLSSALELHHVARQDTTVPDLATGNLLPTGISFDVDRLHAHVVGRDGANGLKGKTTHQVRPVPHNKPDADQPFNECKHLRVGFVTCVDQDGDTADDPGGDRERFVEEQERLSVTGTDHSQDHATNKAQARFKFSLQIVSIISIPLAYYLPFPGFSLFALIPLSKLVSFTLDMLCLRFGKNKVNLVSFTSSAIFKMTVQIAALRQCQLVVAQLSLVGSILANLLLIPGVCLFVGCIRSSEVGFGTNATLLDNSELTLGVISILLPAAFYSAVRPTRGIHPPVDTKERHDILSISHGVAVILFFIFVFLRIFRFVIRKELSRKRTHHTSSLGPTPNDAMVAESVETGLHEEGEMKAPQINVAMAISLFLVVAVIVMPVIAGNALSILEGMTTGVRIGFTGFVLLPIIEIVIEYEQVIAVTGFSEKTLARAIHGAVDSIIETVFFVTPITLILGWIMHKPMTLLFDPLHCVVLLLSLVAVNCVARNGKSNWLEGMILICLYVIVAVIFWFYPATDPAGLLASCQ